MPFLYRDGEEWQKHRTALNRHMMRPKNVAEYTDDLNPVVTDAMDSLLRRMDAAGELADLEKLLFRWSLECECKNALNGHSFHQLHMYILSVTNQSSQIW